MYAPNVHEMRDDYNLRRLGDRCRVNPSGPTKLNRATAVADLLLCNAYMPL